MTMKRSTLKQGRGNSVIWTSNTRCRWREWGESDSWCSVGLDSCPFSDQKSVGRRHPSKEIEAWDYKCEFGIGFHWSSLIHSLACDKKKKKKCPRWRIQSLKIDSTRSNLNLRWHEKDWSQIYSRNKVLATTNFSFAYFFAVFFFKWAFLWRNWD